MTAYFGGRLSQAEWSKIPDFAVWLRQMTQPPRKLSNAELLAFFRGHGKPN